MPQQEFYKAKILQIEDRRVTYVCPAQPTLPEIVEYPS